VDVVLVVAHLVCPGPFVQIRGSGHVVEATIPQDRARGHGAHERVDDSCLSEHVDD